MTDPEITVKKYAHYVPATILGKDEHGRTLIMCPSRGCGDTATIMEDGRVVCPTDEAMQEYLVRALAEFEPSVRPDWLGPEVAS